MSLSTLEESTPSLTSRSGSGRELWREEKEAGEEEDGEEGEEVVVWQGRCLELEDSLARFRDQAHRIREILKEKVRLLKSRNCIAALFSWLFSRLSFVTAMHCNGTDDINNDVDVIASS